MNPKKPLTKKQTLRKADPLWADSPRISVVTRKSATAASYDVVIVGAGISGALMAHALCAQDLRILVIDRRKPVRGSSLASTAMIQHEIDLPLHTLIPMIGKERAQRVWQRSAKAVEELATTVADLGLDCQFQRKRTLFLAGEEYGSRALATEAEARHEAGIDCTLLSAADLEQRFDLDRTAAIDSNVSASANPAQLTAGILRHARKAGVEIVAGIEIAGVHDGADEVVLATDDGVMISARHVVFCTGYEFLEALDTKNQSLISTWAMASRPYLPRPKWLDSYLVWEGSDPYLYFRTTPDGRVVVGGEDEDGEDAYKDLSKVAAKKKRLIEKLGDLTGIAIGTPDHIWSAAFGITPDGLPMIGRVPGMSHVFTTMGFGGNGITFSQIAAGIISAEILGYVDEDAALFPIR